MKFEHLVPQVHCAGLGAVIGDMVGSVYEEDGKAPPKYPFFARRSAATDDTVLTLAVAEGLMDSWGKEESVVLVRIRNSMQSYAKKYPCTEVGLGYGGRFLGWIDNPVPYNSFGNGSAMRVSSVGWLFNTLEDVLKFARLTALPSHNHPEGIKGAQATAAAIFLARCGVDKADIASWITKTFGYNLRLRAEDIRNSYRWDISCQKSVPEAIFSFLQGENFEDVVRFAIGLGGDTDTIGAIAGSIAEAYYPIPQKYRQEALRRLDPFLLKTWRRYEAFVAENVAARE